MKISPILKKCIEKVSEDLDADIFIYSGEIGNQGLDEILKVTKKKNRLNALLLLSTYGGCPHAAFKIAKRMQNSYKRFYLYLYGFCKSAGTLIAVGSDMIIMSDIAELGPLDMQVKEDEFFSASSLNIGESIQAIKDETFQFFLNYASKLIKLRISSKNSLKVASNFACNYMVSALDQIDLTRIGEIRRAIYIAFAYSERLIKHGRGNIKGEQVEQLERLKRLVLEYPDHGFVIDLQEAITLFNYVRSDKDIELELAEHFLPLLRYPSKELYVKNLTEEIYETDESRFIANSEQVALGEGEKQ